MFSIYHLLFNLAKIGQGTRLQNRIELMLINNAVQVIADFDAHNFISPPQIPRINKVALHFNSSQ
jgi:hypothetical protein